MSILFRTSSTGSSSAPISASTSLTRATVSRPARRRASSRRRRGGSDQPRASPRAWREALHELVRESADEAHRVGDEVAAALLESPRRRVERLEEAIVDGDARAGERVEERRLAGVRVAGERDCRRGSGAARACASARRCRGSGGAVGRRPARRASAVRSSRAGLAGASVPTPPSIIAPRRSRCCCRARMRGRLYSSCASSTWSFPGAARAARRCRGSAAWSTTRAFSSSSSFRCWDGLSSWSTSSDSAPTVLYASLSSTSLPLPTKVAGPASPDAGSAKPPAPHRRSVRAPRSRRASRLSSVPGASTDRMKPRSGSTLERTRATRRHALIMTSAGARFGGRPLRAPRPRRSWTAGRTPRRSAVPRPARRRRSPPRARGT